MFIHNPPFLIRQPMVPDAPLMHAALKASFSELQKWMPWAKKRASMKDVHNYITKQIDFWSYHTQEERILCIFYLDRIDKNLIYKNFIYQDIIYQNFKHKDLIYPLCFIGTVSIQVLNTQPPRFALGYWIDQRLRGQGFMTQALSLVIHTLQGEHQAQRLEIHVDPSNIKSIALAERLGFMLEEKINNKKMRADQHDVSESLLYVYN